MAQGDSNHVGETYMKKDGCLNNKKSCLFTSLLTGRVVSNEEELYKMSWFSFVFSFILQIYPPIRSTQVRRRPCRSTSRDLSQLHKIIVTLLASSLVLLGCKSSLLSGS